HALILAKVLHAVHAAKVTSRLYCTVTVKNRVTYCCQDMKAFWPCVTQTSCCAWSKVTLQKWRYQRIFSAIYCGKGSTTLICYSYAAVSESLLKYLLKLLAKLRLNTPMRWTSLQCRWKPTRWTFLT